MKNSKGKSFIIVGLLLFAAALALISYNVYDANRAEKASDAVMKILTSQVEKNMETTEQDYISYPNMEMPTVLINGERYIGYVEIPDLNIKLPVANECNLTKLKTSPCLYSGSVYLDNMVIAAHNYSKHFGKLKNLPIGSKIIFTDAAGNVFEYEIGWVETLEDNDKEGMISAEDWDLTLFTCTYGGEKRYAFRCLKTEK